MGSNKTRWALESTILAHVSIVVKKPCSFSSSFTAQVIACSQEKRSRDACTQSLPLPVLHTVLILIPG